MLHAVSPLLALLPADGDDGPPGGIFYSITGIPVHPLVVHAAVVLVPLAAAMGVACVLRPSWAKKYLWLAVAFAGMGAVASFIAKESGEQLERQVGEPGFDHAEYGDLMPLVAGLLLLCLGAMWLAMKKSADSDSRSPLVLVTSIAVVGAAIFATVWMVLVGHSGAKSVWEEDMKAPPAASSGESNGD